MKKIFIICCLFIVSNIQAISFTAGGINYIGTNSAPYTASVSTHSSFTGTANIPASVINNGITYDVTSIGYAAFYYCSGLTSVIIPNSVTTIGNLAFQNCTSLTAVNIPNSVATIGNNTFFQCTNLTSVIIPNSVTSIGNYAFSYCTSLTSLNIPNSVLTIGSKAFYYSDALATVNIPNSVTSIGAEAFYNCSSLTSIAIPNSVLTIGESAFQNCTSLTSISIPTSITNVEAATFRYCTGLNSVNIPNSIKTIGNYAFSYCTGLTTVNIPNSVTSIQYGAFGYCTGLNTVSINNSTPITINANAFVGLDTNKIPLYVPVGAWAAYTYSPTAWGTFYPIIEAATLSKFAPNNISATIYPNPVADKLQINLNTLETIQTVDIYNTTGQLILSLNIKENFPIDVTNLLAGIYFVKISTKTSTDTVRIVKI